MTDNKDFKRLVRERMDRTGESYTTARAHLAGGNERPPAPNGYRAPISQSRWFRLLAARVAKATGTTTDGFIEIAGGQLRVQSGNSFQMEAPIASVIDVSPFTGKVRGWGVHGGDGTWLVNGTSKNIVAIRFDPPAEATMSAGPMSGTVPVTELRISVDDPSSLIAAIAAAHRTTPPNDR